MLVAEYVLNQDSEQAIQIETQLIQKEAEKQQERERRRRKIVGWIEGTVEEMEMDDIRENQNEDQLIPNDDSEQKEEKLVQYVGVDVNQQEQNNDDQIIIPPSYTDDKDSDYTKMASVYQNLKKDEKISFQFIKSKIYSTISSIKDRTSKQQPPITSTSSPAFLPITQSLQQFEQNQQIQDSNSSYSSISSACSKVPHSIKSVISSQNKLPTFKSNYSPIASNSQSLSNSSINYLNCTKVGNDSSSSTIGESVSDTNQSKIHTSMSPNPTQQTHFHLVETLNEQKARLKQTDYSNLITWNILSFIAKENDDVRQDQLISQLLKIFQHICEIDGVDIWLRPYSVAVTGKESGLIETVPETKSITVLKSGYLNYIEQNQTLQQSSSQKQLKLEQNSNDNSPIIKQNSQSGIEKKKLNENLEIIEESKMIQIMQQQNQQSSQKDFGQQIQLLNSDSSLTQPDSRISQPPPVKNVSLKKLFLESFGQEDSEGYNQAVVSFVKSLAGYSIASYLLQLKDRHNGNLMLDKSGHIVHIDFGFILGRTPGNLGWENAPFKLTNEMIEILGGIQSPYFQMFRSLATDMFLSIRKRAANCIIKFVGLMAYPTITAVTTTVTTTTTTVTICETKETVGLPPANSQSPRPEEPISSQLNEQNEIINDYIDNQNVQQSTSQSSHSVKQQTSLSSSNINQKSSNDTEDHKDENISLQFLNPEQNSRISSVSSSTSTTTNTTIGSPLLCFDEKATGGKTGEEVVQDLYRRFMLGLTEEQARDFIHGLIDQALSSRMTTTYDMFQKFTNNILP